MSCEAVSAYQKCRDPSAEIVEIHAEPLKNRPPAEMFGIPADTLGNPAEEEEAITRLIWERKVDAAKNVPLRAKSPLKHSRLTRFDCTNIVIIKLQLHGRSEHLRE